MDIFKLIPYLFYTMPVLGYPSGAPCGISKPNHPSRPQTGHAPYIIEVPEPVLAGCYMPDQPISVILKTTDVALFKGFVLAAYSTTEDGNVTDSDTPLGVYARPIHPGVQWKYHCHTGRITHSNNTDKRSTVVLWKWRNPNVSQFRFSSTVVQDYQTFWAPESVQSPIIKVCGREANANHVPATTSKPFVSPPSIELTKAIEEHFKLKRIIESKSSSPTKSKPQAPSVFPLSAPEQFSESPSAPSPVSTPQSPQMRSEDDYYSAYYDDDSLISDSVPKSGISNKEESILENIELNKEIRDTLVSSFADGITEFAKKQLYSLGILPGTQNIQKKKMILGSAASETGNKNKILKKFIKQTIEDIIGPQLLSKLMEAFLTAELPPPTPVSVDKTLADSEKPVTVGEDSMHNLLKDLAQEEAQIYNIPDVIPSAPDTDITPPSKQIINEPPIFVFPVPAMQPVVQPVIPIAEETLIPVLSPTHADPTPRAAELTSKESVYQYETEFHRAIQDYTKQLNQQRPYNNERTLYKPEAYASLYASGLPTAYGGSGLPSPYNFNSQPYYGFSQNEFNWYQPNQHVQPSPIISNKPNTHRSPVNVPSSPRITKPSVQERRSVRIKNKPVPVPAIKPQRISVSSLDLPDLCSKPMDRGGPCRQGDEWQRRWYYSKPFCIEFWWQGCGGNDNNFPTFDECSALCVRPQQLEFTIKL